MEQFSEALAAFIRFQLRADNWRAYAVFALAAGLIGLAVVLLDFCSVTLGEGNPHRPGSVLNLTHGRWATPKAAAVWMLASMLGASLGLLAHVFEPTPLAAVLASLTWRSLLTHLQRLATHSVQQPLRKEQHDD